MTTCNLRQIKSRAKFKNILGVNKWAAQNGLTLGCASNNRAPWENCDDVYLLTSHDKVLDKAIKLGRTKFAVEQRIKLLNRGN